MDRETQGLLPVALACADTCRRGGGGGRPGEVYRAPEPARDGGRIGPDDPGTLMRGMDILVEGVGGRMRKGLCLGCGGLGPWRLCRPLR